MLIMLPLQLSYMPELVDLVVALNAAKIDVDHHPSIVVLLNTIANGHHLRHSVKGRDMDGCIYLLRRHNSPHTNPIGSQNCGMGLVFLDQPLRPIIHPLRPI